jgi:hypothetical protein
MGPRDNENELPDEEELADNEEEGDEFENSGQAYAADIDAIYGKAVDVDDTEDEQDEQ